MKPKALYILNSDAYEWIYGPDERRDIAAMVDVIAPPQNRASITADLSVLSEVEIVLAGWGTPVMDAAFLQQAPRLRAVFYGAGSVRGFVTDTLWERGVVVTSSFAANAVPVSEYTLAAILFSLKHGWRVAAQIKRLGAYPPRPPVPGAYGSTVGLISLGMVGRLVAERLRPFDLRVIAYDPSVQPRTASALNVESTSLEALFDQADVVSLHTPWLPETEGMITGALLDRLKPGATFINTARGAIVRQDELIDVLTRRPDLWAVLDVTYPEPPPPGSPLYTLE
ncbi:MAG: hydroxyacid dehydrogenase, partial [Chloroflexi bacterium]|nr:hydroxyacid dehydrogenase [Chloroflexota bacterium]